MGKALRKVTGSLNIGMDRWMPDALVFALILTMITFVAGIAVGNSPVSMLEFWGKGFWSFLGFSMQMTLIMATGHLVASTPIASRFLVRISSIPKNAVSGVVFVFVVSAILGWISWGLGLVGGAIIAKTVARNLKKVDFKLYVAVAYTGAITLGLFGISGSEFLLVNTPGYFLEDLLGLIPLSQTVFEPSLLIAEFLGIFVLVSVLAALIHPPASETPEMDADVLARFEEQEEAERAAANQKMDKSKMTPGERLDNGRFIVYTVGLGGLAYLVYYFATNGFNLTLDIMNFMLLMLGFLGHGTPRRVIAAAEEGVRSAFGVVLQFPFYAGIQGMMDGSGLVVLIADFFAGISTQTTFPYFTYIAMAIVNFFIPSSGGIFMVAGPALGNAAIQLGVPANHFVIAFTAGETISNIIQPFWAIPLLGIAGLKMKDIMGYCIVFFIFITLAFFGIWALMW